MTERPLSSETIEHLYEQKVLANDNPEYLERYDDYDFGAFFSDADLRRIEFPRLVIIREFARLIRTHGISARRVLMLNGGPAGDPELAHLPHDETDVGDYEQDPDRYDMHALRPPRSDYDFVLFSQTLEHLWDPRRAMQRVFSVTAPGGWIWTSVPTVTFQHDLPYNFITGLTPIGLASLFHRAGFDVIEVGQWGNRKYVSCAFQLWSWPTYYDLRGGIRRRAEPFGETRRRLARLGLATLKEDGTRNEFDVPVQAWILARKPVDSSPVPAD
jgi:SAM-dependent methyltransferase